MQGHISSVENLFWSPKIKTEERPDGSFVISRLDPLGPYPDKITERLVHWAKKTPDQPWLAERDDSGHWKSVTYAQGYEAVRSVAQALLDRGLSVEWPVVILSGNSTEHALLALAAQHVGIPSAAISPAYSLLSKDFGKLKSIAAQTTPGLVFVDKIDPYCEAIDAAFGSDIEVVSPEIDHGTDAAPFSDLLGTVVTDDVDRAFAKVGPDTVAKFLFTSGTTGSPKAVIQTQRMLCSNQAMVLDCYAFARDEPPVLVDWAPWNHTASGNKVFNFALYNGGTYYMDAGKPSPDGMATTIQNLRDVSPTWYFNVPLGYDMLVAAMETDAQLRQSFFKRLKMMMYAGAGMAEHTWKRLGELSEQTVGRKVRLSTGLGATETSPFSLFCTDEQDAPGNVGIPAQGVELKLVPFGEKFEARLRGPNITPGYWRDEKLTEEAFDEEGFYRLGDALRFAVSGDAEKGFIFDGRLAENFKLRSGTWVAVGALRAGLINEFSGLIRDAVITGEDRGELGAILFPDVPALRHAVDAATDESDRDVLGGAPVRALVAGHLAHYAKSATGSATRVTRAIIAVEPPSLDAGEVTDKGSINQRAVLANRPDLIEAIYTDDPRTIRI